MLPPEGDFFLADTALQEEILYQLELLYPEPEQTAAITTLPHTPTKTNTRVPALLSETQTPAISRRGTTLAFPVLGAMLFLLTVIGGSLFGDVSTSQAAPKKTAIQTLQRIAQLDPAQYTTPEEFHTWAYGACSTTAMTEVINAYEALKTGGHHYHISDILHVEITQHAIQVSLGLVEPAGIDRTVAHFGYITKSLTGQSLDTIIETAQQGHPVIVGWPPARWKGGHLLIVRGGTKDEVWLTDSSWYNFQHMSRTRFLQLWAGFAVLVESKGGADA